MDDRKQKLLRLIIENHIDTGAPVGSKFLIETSELGVSAATVRNEMRDLEEKGLLTHPHTSAGRLPTESGYRYYIKHLMKPVVPKKEVKDEFGNIAMDTDYRDKAKLTAKLVSSQVNNAVIVAFGGKSVYYTGISFLFSQPEFQNYLHMVNVSSIFDQCEERMEDLYEAIGGEESKILVGSNNPLGNACSLVGRRLNADDLFVILGPMRMDYGSGVGLLDYIHGVAWS
jgi:transcriptional regulator of heat shock response